LLLKFPQIGQATGLPVKEYFVNGRFFILSHQYVRIEHSNKQLTCLVVKEQVNCNQKLKSKIFGEECIFF